MFVIFGTKGREEPRGIVAEHCPSCGGPRPFNVIEHYEVGHIYYIPLGNGSKKGVGLRCVECRSEFHFNPHKYAAVLPASVARGCSFEELIERTNPRLAEQLGLADAASRPTQVVGAAEAVSQAAVPTACAKCGYQRDRAFRFCPVCGTPGAE
ncbi:MAG: zinc-ribbon domain-containing protein [Armatimonadetes bacterium]|nr:zinc-ribbon domain-containing protein [Armatimonadota bacterium]